MQNLKKELEKAFDLCLSGHYKQRVHGMVTYWAKDATFHHISFKTFNRDDAWGVYQLWSCNNLGIQCDFLEIFSDKKHNSVLLDVLERCHIWWLPIPGPDVRIHTILDLRDTEHGKVICYQYDHTLMTESILYHQMPWLGAIVKKHVLPATGAAMAALGKWMYHYMHPQPPALDLTTPLLIDPESSIPRSAEILFSCNSTERYALVHCAFDKSAQYYNTYLTVDGPDAIFGVFNFWANVNHSIKIKVIRVVPCGSRIMVDAVQTWTPYLWPTFLIHAPVWYQHILIDTKDNPRGGKLITKVENFIITLDPFLKYQIGPLYEAMRIINGRLFGMAGRTLYRLLEWWHSSQVGEKIAAHIPNGVHKASAN